MSQEEWHRETSPFNNLLQITLSLKNFILYSPSEELSPKTKTKIHVFLPTVFFTQNKTKKQRANLCLTGVIKWHQPNFHSLLQGKSLKLISVVLLRMKQHPTILIPLPKWVPFNNHPRSRELVSVLQVIGSLLEGDAARRGLKAEAGWEPFGWIFMLVFETGGSVYNKMCGVKPYGDVVENGIIK